MQSSIPPSEQSISHNGRELTDPTATIRALGVGEHAMLLLRRRVNVPGPQGRSAHIMFSAYLVCMY
ncbi:hypothetical protein DFH29DRAFT_410956 [Suillus ampliporus]|nr:hypothetical protein DFH29DRAFT_410956 [Suillus ampliporus]